MNDSAGLFIIIYIVVIFGALTSYIANIVKFVGLLGGDVTAMFIARIAGIVVPPLGVILGIF